MIRLRILALGLIVCSSVAAIANGQTKLLRFPGLHEDTVVFSHAGDLWTAPVDGGLARRLTAHPGMELFPKFSPDGSQIAFLDQYDGDEQVYVIPRDGSEPKRLRVCPIRGTLGGTSDVEMGCERTTTPATSPMPSGP